MGTKDVLEEALKLKPDERFMIVEGLIQSLDEPDRALDALWAEEAEKRLKAYRAVPLKECRWRKYSRKRNESPGL